MTDQPRLLDQDDTQPSVAPRKRPKAWTSQTDAWRWNRRISERYVNIGIRLRSGNILPASMQSRILVMGIPPDILKETLQEIRHTSQWSDEWIETAQRFLGDYRRQISASQRREAAQARMLAGLCYHIAQLIPGPDQRTLEHCRGAAATLAGQALAELSPTARKIDIPWRNQNLASILIPGPDQPNPSSLVVVFNGVSTIKEELLRWMSPISQAGIAVLLIDTPGTGESRHLGPPQTDDEDLLDGVFDILRSYPTIDPQKVGVLGTSLGGNIAIRCMAYDRRIAAGAVVTAPFEPGRWIERASPLVKQELSSLFHQRNASRLSDIVEAFSLRDVAPHVKQPVLTIGAGRDLVIPPSESTLLASALGASSTLVWYPEAGHALYQEIPAWSTDVAYWFDSVLQGESTQVDDLRARSRRWERALDRKPRAADSWDESEESTRLIGEDEVVAQETPRAQTARTPMDEYSRAFDDDFAASDRDARSDA